MANHQPKTITFDQGQADNGHQINYIRQGEGPPVILIHGIAASLSDWEFLMPALSAAGYASYALDLLGHGDSSKPDRDEHYHFRSLFHHLSDWIAGLQLQAPPVLIGHSLGGFLCLNYALERPMELQALVLIDPFYSKQQLSLVLRLLNRRPAFGERALRLAPLWFIQTIMGWDMQAAHFSNRTRQQIAEDYKRASPKITHIAKSVPDLNNRLERVRSPALVIWGNRDRTLHPATFPTLVERLPHAQGHSIEDCGHQPHLGKPALVNRLVIDFLAGQAI
ncbi:MAG TPA: alpha/beta hydrolase [Anaerolineales bacterium]|nr:alpha/beta hydrolase [Anaerolineales bacterium]